MSKEATVKFMHKKILSIFKSHERQICMNSKFLKSLTIKRKLGDGKSKAYDFGTWFSSLDTKEIDQKIVKVLNNFVASVSGFESADDKALNTASKMWLEIAYDEADEFVGKLLGSWDDFGKRFDLDASFCKPFGNLHTTTVVRVDEAVKLAFFIAKRQGFFHATDALFDTSSCITHKYFVSEKKTDKESKQEMLRLLHAGFFTQSVLQRCVRLYRNDLKPLTFLASKAEEALRIKARLEFKNPYDWSTSPYYKFEEFIKHAASVDNVFEGDLSIVNYTLSTRVPGLYGTTDKTISSASNEMHSAVIKAVATHLTLEVMRRACMRWKQLS